MVKLLLNARRSLVVATLCLMAAVASATPYKNINIRLTVNETGRGRVYIKTEDSSNLQSRKSEDVKMKCTLGENGNDTQRDKDEDPLHGLYMVWLYAEPEDGYELAGFSLEKKEDGAYTKADMLTSTWTDNGNFTDPYPSDDEFIFNANCDRPEDANTNDYASTDEAREAARAKDNWNAEPDHTIYAVFLPEGTVLPDGDDPTGISSVTAAGEKKTGTPYNLSGQRVGTQYKGIVIVNGKKRLQK